MAQSPSPLSARSLNCATPASTERKTKYGFVEPHSIYEDAENIQILPIDGYDGGSSSPRVVTGLTSPFKIKQIHSSPDQVIPRSPFRSPRKPHSPSRQLLRSSALLTETALRENEGVTRTIHMLECDGNESMEHDANNDTTSTMEGPQGYPGMDDTDFTTFSAVPNADMTLFTQIGQSPSRMTLNKSVKSANLAHHTDESPIPEEVGHSTPGSMRRNSFHQRSPSPTPRRQKTSYEGDTNLLLDFTEQFSAFAQSSSRSPHRSNHLSPKKSQTQSNLASYISGCRTPSPNKRQNVLSEARHQNLLDFDLPPAPTPRSIPSITARELESLKSSFLSQVSSLRATLSGKEAEVNSLKDAVADAERRVGEALEEIREERGTKESLQAEKLDWERRDKEMQTVLRNVKELNIQTDRERDQLQQRLEESEHRREDLEAKTIEIQSKIAGLEASALVVASSDGTADVGNISGNVEAAVEKVAKELHGLYRKKHEVKVAALKDSYRSRWERKVHELENRIEDLGRENEELRLGRDATLSSVLPGNLPTSLEDSENHIKQRMAETQRLQETEVQLADMGAELSSVKHENASLLTQLKRERQELAELVAATEEMIQLSLEPSTIEESQATSHAENLRGSISRAGVGLKAPGESRIGRMAGGGRGFGLGGTRSGIMGNIERMGRRRVVD